MSLAQVEMTTMASKYSTWEEAGTPLPAAISRPGHGIKRQVREGVLTKEST